jgi:hypothetical protein
MPVPGPRTQFGPDPGYTNPDHELPDRFNLWQLPPPVAMEGRSPGLMAVTLRGCVQGAGQIRQMWRQSINYTMSQPGYSWTENGHIGEHAIHAVGITRALRYMTRSFYMGSGIDNTRFEGLHTEIMPRVKSMPATLGSGQVRTRPTVRNRTTSFGSRVPTINRPSAAAE